MRRGLAALAVLAAGCAAPGLPYRPAEQPAGFPISADYKVVGDRLRVEIDTGGYRLEEAAIVRPDGGAVPPQAVESPGPRGDGRGGGLGVGVGVGSAGRTGRVGIGAGVGVGTTLGAEARAESHTFVWIPLDQAGPGPWRLRVKVVGVQPTDIVLGPR